MSRHDPNQEVPVLKYAAKALPIPSIWRQTLAEIADAFVARDYRIERGIPGVEPVSAESARHIASYIGGYGEELITLPSETWATSCCQWTGNHWDVLVDLWTRREGRSDMVLSARVSELSDGYRFQIHMVYVP